MFGDESTNFNPDASQEDPDARVVSQQDDADDKTHATPPDADLVAESEPSDVTRQLSTTEYLSGMINSEGPSGLLPLFSSWSLICLGAPNIYVPSHGKIFYRCFR